MGKLVDLTGQRFGRLTVVERAGNSADGRARWLCACDCGETAVVLGSLLRKGAVQSCGCLRRERMIAMNRKHNEFRIDENQVIVELSNTSKEIITDLDTWKRAEKYCWSISMKGYAVAKIPETGKVVPFHVFAFPDCPDGMVRDHINGNKLDNRRENIRFVRQHQNSQNRGNGKNNTSGHVGVSWHKVEKKWAASITVSEKRIHLGYFPSLQDAIAAREAAEIKYFGEYRRKNHS